jgi:hypothetical protein
MSPTNLGERARPGRSLARRAPNTNTVGRPQDLVDAAWIGGSPREVFGAGARRTAAGAAALPILLNFSPCFVMEGEICLSFSFMRIIPEQ